MIKKASFSALMAALGAVSALGDAGTRTPADCDRMQKDAAESAAIGDFAKAERLRRQIAEFCNCPLNDVPLLSTLGEGPQLG